MVPTETTLLAVEWCRGNNAAGSRMVSMETTLPAVEWCRRKQRRQQYNGADGNNTASSRMVPTETTLPAVDPKTSQREMRKRVSGEK